LSSVESSMTSKVIQEKHENTKTENHEKFMICSCFRIFVLS
jgi:hypothetical protein